MKKTFNSILICCIMALVLTFSLASCNKSCEHVYDDCADIECNLCGETRDSMHTWKDADCVTPKTCTVCQKTDGEALGHEWTTPDVDQCEVQSTCSRCGATEGHNKEHTYDNECDTTCNTCGKARATEHTPNADDGDCTTAITCSVCGDVTTAGKAQHVAHTDDGDCTTPVTCTECSTVITAAKSHDFSGVLEKDASGHWHVCANEGCTKTDTKADHTSDGAATEEKAEKCTVCEYVITPELEHTHNHNIPKFDNDNHWIECACGDKSAVTAHTANNDDGDCTTAVTCSGCAHIMTAAKAHTPNADDGDCTTDITCKDCSKVTTAGYKEHTPKADDGDCTTAITCQYCDVVTTEARNEHTGGTPTCTHGKLCEVCGVEYDTTKNPDNHVFIDGVCACGELQTIDATEMTAEQLNAAVAELLASGVTDITIKMSADADMDMFTALRTALAESTAPDGSINLTISGAKTVPDEGFIDMLDYFENDDKNIAGDKLKSLTLTDVETIGEYAFSACTNLEAVNMPKVVTIGEYAFNEWKKGTKLTSLDLPNATTIGDCAFAYSSLLTSVNLPKVVTIGENAFGSCDIRILDLPEVTTIGGGAFEANYNLVSCSAPKATTIGYYPWGNCSKLETLELTAAGDITISNNYFANTLTGQINLVLNKDKESQVTQNDDGTATWNIKDGYGNFYTFKSITFACSDGTTNHDYQYSDNGDGTHKAVCSVCDNLKTEDHTIENHVCTACGAMEIVVSFNADGYEWKSGDQIKIEKTVGYDSDYYTYTASVDESGTLTWTPDKKLYWNGEDEYILAAFYPAVGQDDYMSFELPGDQSTLEKLKSANCMNAVWIGKPSTDPINFQMKHRLSMITIDYDFASEFTNATVDYAQVIPSDPFVMFDAKDGGKMDEPYGVFGTTIDAYHDAVNKTIQAIVIPCTYPEGQLFMKISVNGKELQVIMPMAKIFEEGTHYTFKILITADGAYIVCNDGCSFEYSDNGDGTHDEVCSKCGYVKVDNEKHTFGTDYKCVCGASLPVVDLSKYESGSVVDITENVLIVGDGNEYNVSLNIAENVTVTFDAGTSGVKLTAPITVADGKTLTLIIAGDAEHTVNGGISLGNASNVIIEGDLDKPNNKLTVTATDGNAGIGANNGVTAGDITIRNARVEATGSGSSDGSGAAIGTSNASMGNILIENSIVTAAGGYYNSDDFMEISHAAAIGMGYYGGTMGNITLKDSEITASNNGDGLASVIGAGSQNKEGDNNAGTLGDIIITNTDLNLSMVIGTEICYAAVIGPGMGYSFAWTNMGKIIFTDMTQEQLDAIIPTWLPSDFDEWGAYALGRGYDGSAYKKETFGGVWVSDGNGDTVQIGNKSGYYCLNPAIQ